MVLLAGLGVFSMRHKDIWGVAESFLEFVHANPHHHFVGVFIDLVYRISDVRLWKIAVVAAVYVILRFVEAYGLWYVRSLGGVDGHCHGSMYIPFEVADLLRRPDWIRLLIIVINVGIVLYMVMLRLEAAKKRHARAFIQCRKDIGDAEYYSFSEQLQSAGGTCAFRKSATRL